MRELGGKEETVDVGKLGESLDGAVLIHCVVSLGHLTLANGFHTAEVNRLRVGVVIQCHP